MLIQLLKGVFSRETRKALDDLAFESGMRAYERGEFAAAAEILGAWSKSHPGDAAAHYQVGLAAAKCKRYAEALAFFERALALDPANADFQVQAGMMRWRLGENAEAWKHCEAALERRPGMSLAHELMSVIALPGPIYFELLPRIHAFLRPRTYLEIGVESGRSIQLALPETRAVGIDPAADVRYSLGPRTTIRRTTSDDYFAGQDILADFGGLPVDLAFLDGMHNFEFALRDFINVEKHCARGSTILIHDCYPLNRETATREHNTHFWSGDTWRLFLALRKYRPDLRLHTIAAAPTGLAVARNLNPGSRVLEQNYDAIVSEHLALDYSVLDADKPGTLSLYPNEWERIEAILR